MEFVEKDYLCKNITFSVKENKKMKKPC